MQEVLDSTGRQVSTCRVTTLYLKMMVRECGKNSQVRTERLIDASATKAK